jgi:hypothetical protein
LADSSPPDPAATSATPVNERPAASQKRRLSVSTPVPLAKSAVKIGSVPKSSATVVAVVNFNA